MMEQSEQRNNSNPTQPANQPAPDTSEDAGGEYMIRPSVLRSLDSGSSKESNNALPSDIRPSRIGPFFQQASAATAVLSGGSAKSAFGVAVFLYTAFLLSILLLINYTSDIHVSSMQSYNVVHIIVNLLAWGLFLSTLYFCKVLHKSILSHMLNNKKGATLNDMASSWFLGSVPGGSLRAFMLVMTLVIDALLFTGSYYIAFSPKQSLVTKTDCTPATYPDPISHIDELGTFLQGDVDLALVYAYLLPLGDGAIGGWSSWPLANPAPKFSLSRDGTVYLQRVQCFEEYAASLNTSSDGTVIHMSSSQVFGNFFHGTFLVYMPAGSQESAFDAGHGIWQECTAIVGFGMGTVEFNFASDEWDMVIFSTISKIKLDQRNAVEQGSSKSRYFEEFRPMITTDNYNLTSQYQSILQKIFTADHVFYSSQGASFCNILSWATLPDGFYYTNITWQGLSAALGVASHYMLMQYDGTAVSQCEYLGYTGAGRIAVTAMYLLVAKYLCYGMLGITAMTLLWVYLIYPIKMESDIVYTTIDNPILFAHGIKGNVASLYGSSPEWMIDSLPEDILRKCGDSVACYGVKKETVSKGVYQLSYGGKRDVIPIASLSKKICSKK